MQIRKIIDGICEWEFKIKLKEAMEDGWEPIDKTMDIVPIGTSKVLKQYFIVIKKEEDIKNA